METHLIQQKNPDGTTNQAWLNLRLGCVTGSRVSDIMAKTKSGYSTSRDNYMMQLLCERLTGKQEESFSSAAMQRGTEKEPIARGCYEAIEGVMVEEIGIMFHKTIGRFGASVDGRIGKRGLEIKNPNTKQHVEFLRTQKPEGKYQWQMLAQISCCEFDGVDFVSFDDRMPKELQYSKISFMRDDSRIKEMEDEVILFLLELAKLEQEMREKIKRA